MENEVVGVKLTVNGFIQWMINKTGKPLSHEDVYREIAKLVFAYIEAEKRAASIRQTGGGHV